MTSGNLRSGRPAASQRVYTTYEAGTGTVNGHPYEAGHTADAVKDAWYTIGFAQAFSQGPRFVAGLASYDGWDSAAVRYKGSSLGSGSVQVMIEEDTAYDSETAHTSEVVAWWAIQGDGTLTSEVYTDDGSLATSYYYANDERVALRRGGDLYYLFADHLGSTHVAYQPADGRTSRQGYYPWGTIRPGPDNLHPTERTFTGQLLDESVDLMYYGARFYDPVISCLETEELSCMDLLRRR